MAETDQETILRTEDGLLFEMGSGNVLGYLFSHDSRTYAPAGRVGDFTEDEIKAHNAALTRAYLASIERDQVQRLAVYVAVPRINAPATLWTGETVGRVVSVGHSHRTFGDARRVWVRVQVGKLLFGGYATDTRGLVKLRRLAS